MIRRPFDEIPDAPGAPEGGISIATVQAAAALVIARPGQAGLAKRFRSVVGVPLPDVGRRTASGSRSAANIGPGRWMVYDEGELVPLATSIADGLEGLVSVTDQSDALAIVRLSGPAISAMMSKCVAIDLGSSAFGPGHSAVTTVALMRAYVAQLDALPTYEIAVPRSLAGSLLAHLGHYGREFGAIIRRGNPTPLPGRPDA